MSFTSTPTKLAASLLCLAASGAWAADYGTVISSTPVVASVPVAQQQCVEQPVVYPQPSSGAGALIGAIAGAAVGNSMGGGAGRAAATGIGLILGSQIGDRIEAGNSPPVASTVQRCRNVTRYEQRTVGYDVVYEYHGVRRMARLAQDPGPMIALDVNVAPAGSAQAALAPAPAMADDPYVQPRVVYGPAPQVVYADVPQAVINPWPAIAIGAAYYGSYGYNGYYGGGWGGHGHRH